MANKLTNIPTPGSPALAPSFVAKATKGGGALDVPGVSIADPHKIIPAKAFAIAFRGSNLAFYPGMPRVVSADLFAELVAQGGGVPASATWTIGGTALVVGDIVQIAITFADTTVKTFSYVAKATDVSQGTPALQAIAMANGLRAAIQLDKRLTTDSLDATVLVQFLTAGTVNNSAHGTATATPGTAGHATITPTTSTAFTGGANGSYLE